MHKKCVSSVFGIIILLFTVSPAVYSQSNRVIDRVLEQEQATFARALYLVQTASGTAEEDLDPRTLAAEFDAAEWHIPAAAAAEEPITLGEYAQLLMHAFDIRSGIMYRLFPGPRYAAREIEHLGFPRSSGAPGRTVTGDEVVDILRQVLEWKGEQS